MDVLGMTEEMQQREDIARITHILRVRRIAGCPDSSHFVVKNEGAGALPIQGYIVLCPPHIDRDNHLSVYYCRRCLQMVVEVPQ